MAGSIPAVLYNPGGASVAVSVNPKEINKILHSKTGHNTIFDLTLNGSDKTPVMVVDWQHDPIKGRLLHVDLKPIDLSKRLHVKIPVHTTGDPVGVKIKGGLLEVITRDIEIECLPDQIPESFTVDVSSLDLGQSLRAGDVPLSGDMKLVTHADIVLCHVVTIRTTEEAAPAEEVAAPEGKTEPEVIKKGKKEEEAAPPAGKEKKK